MEEFNEEYGRHRRYGDNIRRFIVKKRVVPRNLPPIERRSKSEMVTKSLVVKSKNELMMQADEEYSDIGNVEVNKE